MPSHAGLGPPPAPRPSRRPQPPPAGQPGRARRRGGGGSAQGAADTRPPPPPPRVVGESWPLQGNFPLSTFREREREIKPIYCTFLASFSAFPAASPHPLPIYLSYWFYKPRGWRGGREEKRRGLFFSALSLVCTFCLSPPVKSQDRVSDITQSPQTPDCDFTAG